MAHYKRISKRKDKSPALIEGGADELQDWLGENVNRVLLAVGVVALAAAAVYGASYYRQVSFEDGQRRLYNAARLTPATGATVAQSAEAVAALEELIRAGGPEPVVAQARLELASLRIRAKNYERALEQYRQVASSPAGGLYRELGMAGEATALMMAGKEAEAEPKFAALADGAKLYPRGEALVKLAYTQAAQGKNAQAVAALEKLKADHAQYLPERTVDAIIARIESGDLKKAVDSLKTASAQAPKIKTPASDQPSNIKVHDAGR